jgi:NADPH-dependent 2,4-dienoyl-CoA reductase/sulfur reductase-like enzyme
MASHKIIAVYLFAKRSECNSGKAVALSHGGIWASETGGEPPFHLINRPRPAGRRSPPLADMSEDPNMKSRYSIFSLARNALNYHKDWERAWRSPEPKAEYDAVIVGAGGHGLATAYYLAKNHKLTNIAVVEKGWLGGGNTGRNTTIIRSNYLQDSTRTFRRS